MTLQAPYPWFGGKSRVATEVWSRLGDAHTYLEPFFGSGAILLARPDKHLRGYNRHEFINDLDANVANFWRAIKYNPDEVAKHASYPIHEIDHHAIGDALFAKPSLLMPQTVPEFAEWLRTDEGNYCPIRAGKWCWFVANNISGLPEYGRPVPRTRPQYVYQGVRKILPQLNTHITSECERRDKTIQQIMQALADRMRNVVCLCGDWSRIVSTESIPGTVAVFLDPPYAAEAGRTNNMYSCESLDVAHAVREWALKWGNNPMYRIALCGYEGEHVMPKSWQTYHWKSAARATTDNASKERIWFSPHCKNKRNLFSESEDE